METLKVLSVDPGIVNLGYVYSQITLQVPMTGCIYKNLIINNDYTLNKINVHTFFYRLRYI